MEVVLFFLVILAALVFYFAAATFAVTWALLKGFNPNQTVLIGALVPVLLLFGFGVLDQGSSKEGPTDAIQKYYSDQSQFDRSWTTYSKVFVSSNSTADQVEAAKDYFKKTVYEVVPGWIAVPCFLFGLWAYYLMSFLLSKATTKVPNALNFREWVVPDHLVFGVLLGAGLKALPWSNPVLEILGGNLLVVFGFLFALSGFSIFSFFFNKWKLPPILRFLSYYVIFSCCFYFPLDMVATIGILDVWLDLRGLKRPKSDTVV